ncbi:hypothetical protein Sjap_025460 [Stephania japonica]|uniref:S-protein homolog n=1 Tax=Stephania japonica TaxID=461633 RepID=A0AAP0HFP0_9MAGN
MGGKKAMLSFMILMMLVACNCGRVAAKIRFSTKGTVLVRSEILGYHVLGVHCKSKNDDLGLHRLSYVQEYKFSFSEAIFAHTLFWCHMSWTDSDGKVKDATFDVYDATKEPCGSEASCELEYRVNNYGVTLYNAVTDERSEVLVSARVRQSAVRTVIPAFTSFQEDCS